MKSPANPQPSMYLSRRTRPPMFTSYPRQPFTSPTPTSPPPSPANHFLFMHPPCDIFSAVVYAPVVSASRCCAARTVLYWDTFPEAPAQVGPTGCGVFPTLSLLGALSSHWVHTEYTLRPGQPEPPLRTPQERFRKYGTKHSPYLPHRQTRRDCLYPESSGCVSSGFMPSRHWNAAASAWRSTLHRSNASTLQRFNAPPNSLTRQFIACPSCSNASPVLRLAHPLIH